MVCYNLTVYSYSFSLCTLAVNDTLLTSSSTPTVVFSTKPSIHVYKSIFMRLYAGFLELLWDFCSFSYFLPGLFRRDLSASWRALFYSISAISNHFSRGFLRLLSFPEFECILVFLRFRLLCRVAGGFSAVW